MGQVVPPLSVWAKREPGHRGHQIAVRNVLLAIFLGWFYLGCTALWRKRRGMGDVYELQRLRDLPGIVRAIVFVAAKAQQQEPSTRKLRRLVCCGHRTFEAPKMSVDKAWTYRLCCHGGYPFVSRPCRRTCCTVLLGRWVTAGL